MPGGCECEPPARRVSRREASGNTAFRFPVSRMRAAPRRCLLRGQGARAQRLPDPPGHGRHGLRDHAQEVRAEARTACKDSSLACICFGTKLNLNEFATVACFVVCAVGDVLVHAQARKKKPKQKG